MVATFSCSAQALKYYHMAIQCNPRFAQTLNNLGLVLSGLWKHSTVRAYPDLCSGVAYTTSGRLTEATCDSSCCLVFGRCKLSLHQIVTTAVLP